jgi:hypothetical protein
MFVTRSEQCSPRVQVVTACKWVHVGLIVMGHNDKLKLLEATRDGVTLHVADDQLAAYQRNGSIN